MNTARVRQVAISVILITIAVVAWVTWQRSSQRAISDTIIGPWDALDGEPWLLPNLENARCQKLFGYIAHPLLSLGLESR